MNVNVNGGHDTETAIVTGTVTLKENGILTATGTGTGTRILRESGILDDASKESVSMIAAESEIENPNAVACDDGCGRIAGVYCAGVCGSGSGEVTYECE